MIPDLRRPETLDMDSEAQLQAVRKILLVGMTQQGLRGVSQRGSLAGTSSCSRGNPGGRASDDVLAGWDNYPFGCNV